MAGLFHDTSVVLEEVQGHDFVSYRFEEHAVEIARHTVVAYPRLFSNLRALCLCDVFLPPLLFCDYLSHAAQGMHVAHVYPEPGVLAGISAGEEIRTPKRLLATVHYTYRLGTAILHGPYEGNTVNRASRVGSTLRSTQQHGRT